MNVGEEWVYRQRDEDESRRALIVAIGAQKKPRLEIQFPDSDAPQIVHNVPSGRLRALWCERETFDALMASWNRMRAELLTDAEQSAADTVFDLVIPTQIAECEWSPVKYATLVRDVDALSNLVELDTAALIIRYESFPDGTATRLGPAATLVLAAAAARAQSQAVLAWVDEDERKVRHLVKNGREATSLAGETYTTSPEWEYQWYLEHHRPVNELLREWCGHRAITTFERLAAAEAEVLRLDQIIEQLLTEAERLPTPGNVTWIARDYEAERITPYNVRTLVERPLKPSEIPVRIEYVRRWGGYRS